MRAVDTIKNIWKIDDLRKRIIFSVGLILVYRFLSVITIPGINPADLGELQKQTAGGLMSLLDMFSGGAFSHASIVALGIMPYISASIVMQLLAIAVPHFQKLQREGESGRRKMNQYTRYLTVLILLVQSPTYLVNLSVQMRQAGAAYPSGAWFMFSSTIILAAGSMFVLWLGEKITDKGIGNGVSFIIMVGIIARLPKAISQEIVSRMSTETSTGGGLIMILIEIIVLLGVIAGAILLVQ
jgi:preprotein translocase subunit SecY